MIVSLVGWIIPFFMIIFTFGLFIDLSQYGFLHLIISYVLSVVICAAGIAGEDYETEIKKAFLTTG